MSDAPNPKRSAKLQSHLPSAERGLDELSSATSMDDFFGKEGIFARLFAKTMEAMLEAEMTEHLEYGAHESKGWNSGNSRNGHRSKKVRTPPGETNIPRFFNSFKEAIRSVFP